MKHYAKMNVLITVGAQFSSKIDVELPRTVGLAGQIRVRPDAAIVIMIKPIRYRINPTLNDRN